MRSIIPALALALAVALPATASSQWAGDGYSAPRSAAATASGATRVFVHAEAGSLRVEGKAGLTEVRATGTANASRKKDLDEIQLSATRDGAEVRVIVDIPDHSNWNGNHYRGLDLVVEVPITMAVAVEDGSGAIEILSVGSIEVTDGSGEVHIRGVTNDVYLVDGSGEIRVEDVGGNLVVGNDGSGEIRARDIKGDVRVRRDGSGSIRVADVGGSFIVDRDGSGGIDYDRVKGEIKLPRNK